MELLEMLENIGVPKKEAQVYIELVKSGGMGAAQLAALVGVHRPNVYDTLRQLEAKGLVGSYVLNGKIFYKALTIEGVRDFLEEKMQNLDEVSKQLEKYKHAEKECEVAVYSGKRALRIVYGQMIETLQAHGGEVLLIGVDERKFMEADNVALMQYFGKLKKMGFMERAIVEEGETYLPAPKETTTYAALKKEYFDSASSFEVYGDYVSIIIFSEPIYFINIKSKRTANAYRKKFELLWKNAKVIRR